MLETTDGGQTWAGRNRGLLNDHMPDPEAEWGHAPPCGAGEMRLRELARRLERDVKSVHRDVHALLETGLLEKTESGKIVCPFDKVRVDFTLAQAV